MQIMRRLSIVTVAIAASLVISSAARAELFSIDGVSIDLRAPSVFCFLSRTNRVDRIYIEQQDEIQAGLNLVVAIAVPCADLENIRSGGEMTQWVLWLLVAPKGHVTMMPDGYTRTEALNELAKLIPLLDTQDIADAVKKKSKSAGIDMDLKRVGVIDQDDNALYIGLLADYATEGDNPVPTAGVSGYTMIKRRLYSVIYYKIFEGRHTFDFLLSQVKPMMAEMVRVNVSVDLSLPEGMEPPQPTHVNARSPFGWERVIRKAAVGALIGALLAALVMAVRRMMR